MTFKTGNYRSGEGSGTPIELSQVLPQGYEWRKALTGQLQLWRVDVSPQALLTEQDVALLDVNGSIRAAVNTLYLEQAHAIKSSGEEIAFKNLETGVNYMPAWAAATPGGTDILPLSGIVEGELILNFEPGGTLLPTGSVSASLTSVITSNSTFYGASYVCAEAYTGVLHLSVRDSRNEEVFHHDIPSDSYVIGSVISVADIFYRVRVGNTRTIGVFKSNGDPLMVRPGSLDPTKPYQKYAVRAFADRRVIMAGGDGKIQLDDLPDLNTSEAKVVNTEAERLALPEVDKLYIVTQVEAGPNSGAGYQWFLNPNTDPSIVSNWVRGANAGNTVLSFAGRSGPVTPQTGDYTAEQVGAVGLPGADSVRRVLIGNTPTQETIADDLVTNSSTSVLSAKQGTILKGSLDSLSQVVSTKQNCVCDNATAWLKANGGNASTTTAQGGSFSTSGSANGVPMSDTPYGRVRKIRFSTTSTAGNTAMVRGTAAYSLNTGFKFVATWSLDSGTPSNMRLFVGFDAVDLANTPIVNRTNCFGVGFENTSANYSTIQNDGTSTAEIVDLGASFPKGSAAQNIYTLEMNCEPLSNIVSYKLSRRVGGSEEVAVGTFTPTNLPGSGDFLRPVIALQTTSNSAVGLGFMSLYIETKI